MKNSEIVAIIGKAVDEHGKRLCEAANVAENE